MKNQKGFIQIPLLIAIIAGVLILGEGGYFGIRQYQKYQTEKIEQKKLTELNQKNEEEQRKKLQELLDSQSEELGKQKSEIEALKNKKPETITQTIIKEVPSPSKDVPSPLVDLSTIISQWEKYIGIVYCQYFVDGKYITPQFGSGVLTKMKFKNQDFCTVSIQTNRHVVLLNGNILPTSCEVQLPDSVNTYKFLWEGGYIGASRTHDASQLGFTPVDNYKSCATADAYINSLVSNAGKKCKRIPQLGEAVVILGYPVTGSANGITATEGIISGYDGDFSVDKFGYHSSPAERFYITSAKIEHGNSGGAAILLKDNCYLGIPTFAKVGEVESMGRILEMSDIDNLEE